MRAPRVLTNGKLAAAKKQAKRKYRNSEEHAALMRERSTTLRKRETMLAKTTVEQLKANREQRLKNKREWIECLKNAS